MGYTLTSEETIRKARELALRTGRTVDQVIDEAITEKLSRSQPHREASAEAQRQARVEAVMDRIRRLPPVDAGDYDADLYDENGLWK